MLRDLALLSEFLPIFVYLIFLKRNRGEGLLVIFLYCVLSLLTEVVHAIWETQLVFSSFTIIEFSLFSFFFYTSLRDRKFKYIPIIGAVVFYAIAIGSFTTKAPHEFDSLPTSVEAVLVISYCILLLYEQIKDPNIVFVYNTKKFWVIIAFFLYFSSTLFLFIYAGSFSEQQHSNYWMINNFFDLLKNILFCVSFIMKKSYKNPYAVDGFEA
ncbi:MAG TPA: hypothetical protein VHE34_01125 [Puia sp.]|uniref:hypothetical protein n=1 Tax=Puia sp. TaxID=2045100 RepID=UPI002CA22CA8|nr:hypothetical protein [Puia sp.]HVU93785.1 hypothetical protein [Puia sp.]